MLSTQLAIKKKPPKRGLKVAWGIAGSGDRLAETIEVMKKIRKEHRELMDIKVFLSKAGKQVLDHYRLSGDLEQAFGRIRVERNSNVPFLAGALQTGKFEFLLIAPASSNTVAKIALGIADALLPNSAIMALKAYIPVYIMPSDHRVGSTITRLPNGEYLQLRIRKEDVDNVKKLVEMDSVHVLEKPRDIRQVFRTLLKA